MVYYVDQKPLEPMVRLVLPWTELQNLTALMNHLQVANGQTDMCRPDVYSSDEFKMYQFKVRRCPFGRGNHDWTDCPFLHPGEKARRRDPKRYVYSSKPCTEFRKHGQCENGDTCQFAHGVFESWLHPEKYKTQLCRDGLACGRKVCFFAHFPGELRGDNCVVVSSPKSVFSPPESPLMEMRAKMAGLKLKEVEDEPDVDWVSELVD
ncbi:hypothetical protein LUZ60_008492 [Juncus effusus]|nr:hypothetical protein LUZ60_008492 [Juncus effusus]